VPITFKRHDLFPDDTNALPAPGSSEQQRLLEDEVEVNTEAYVESLKKISNVANDLYPELIGACVNVLAEAQPERRPLRVMNLCCGAGIAVLELLERDLHIAQLTMVDISPILLERAERLLRKSPHIARVQAMELVQLDPLVDDLARWAPGSFDLVLTVNAFAHFPRSRQQRLFARVYDLLAPAGVFMFASQFKPLKPNWKQTVIADIEESVRQHGAPPDKVAHAGYHVANYHNHLNVADGYNWLESAGFSYFECAFRRSILGIFAAVK
jgi:SAM-dependent methyltransferase